MSGESLDVQTTAHKRTQINCAIEQYPHHLSLPALSWFCLEGPKVVCGVTHLQVNIQRRQLKFLQNGMIETTL